MSLVVTVFKNLVHVNERCLLRADGDYYGIATRQIYPRDEYRHRPVFLARVVRMLDANETGMSYRDTRDHRDLIGQTVEVEEAHLYDRHIVWHEVNTGAYLADLEVELLSRNPIR